MKEGLGSCVRLARAVGLCFGNSPFRAILLSNGTGARQFAEGLIQGKAGR